MIEPRVAQVLEYSKGVTFISDLWLFVEFTLQTDAILKQIFNVRVPKATFSHSLDLSSFAYQRLAQKDHDDNKGWSDNINPRFTKYQQELEE